MNQNSVLIEYLNDNAEDIQTIDQIEQLIPEFLSMFNDKLKKISIENNNNEYNEVAFASTQKSAEKIFKTALETFFIKKQHWKEERNLVSYLFSALNNFKFSEFNRHNLLSSVYCCPLCKNILTEDNKLYHCQNCSDRIQGLEAMETLNEQESNDLFLHKVFEQHSGSGCACPKCNKFIPNSYIKTQKEICCIHASCSWFGSVKEMKPKQHAQKKAKASYVSIDDVKILKADKSTQVNNRKNSSTDIDHIEVLEYINKNINTVNKVINAQKNNIDSEDDIDKDRSSLSTFKKIMMYEAFEQLMIERPEDLSPYLTSNKRLILEQPIQSMIFQKYIELIENRLPLMFNNKMIYSVLDSELELFLGQSEFETFVNSSGVIKNKTHEIYIGAKCNGPCYIGYLSNIIDVNTGKSILSHVNHYSFQKIKLNNIEPRTHVRVVHYRIPPHYEMFSLVLLQKTRRKIVNSVYKRLTGEVRPLRNKVANSGVCN
jgi:hypothetical protein